MNCGDRRSGGRAQSYTGRPDLDGRGADSISLMAALALALALAKRPVHTMSRQRHLKSAQPNQILAEAAEVAVGTAPSVLTPSHTPLRNQSQKKDGKELPMVGRSLP
jgi:hypothetical protein